MEIKIFWEEIKDSMKTKTILLVIVVVILTVMTIGFTQHPKEEIKITELENLPEGTWQAEITFPDWKDYVDE